MNERNYLEDMKKDFYRRNSLEDKNLGLFLIIGIIFIIVGIFLIKNSNSFLEKANTTQAVLYYERDTTRVGKVGENDHYNVYAKYTVNGKEYYELVKRDTSSKIKIGAISFSGTKNGKVATVYYNLENPKEVRLASSNFIGYAVMGMGTLLIIAYFGKVIYKNSKGYNPDLDKERIENFINKIEEIEETTGFIEKSAKIQKSVNVITISLVKIIFTILGLAIFLFGMFVLSEDFEFSKNAVETTGIVSKIESYEELDANNRRYTKTDAYVKYKVDGQSFEEKLDTFDTNNIKKGNTVNIYYNSKDPSEIKTHNTKKYTGAKIMVVGLIILLLGILRKNKEAIPNDE